MTRPTPGFEFDGTTSAADTLRGEAGDDVLLGGPGQGVLDGGPGNNIVIQD